MIFARRSKSPARYTLIFGQEELAQDMQQLALNRIDGHFVHILDPAEKSLPFSGHAVFTGLEEGEAPQKIQDVRMIRAAYQEKLEQHRQALKNIVHAAGWVFHEAGTEADVTAAVLPVYEMLMFRKR